MGNWRTFLYIYFGIANSKVGYIWVKKRKSACRNVQKYDMCLSVPIMGDSIMGFFVFFLKMTFLLN